MKIHYGKKNENKHQEHANAIHNQPTENKSAYQFLDTRTKTIQIQKIHQMAQDSLQLKKLRAIQEMANANAQTKFASQLQITDANYCDSQLQPFQRKKNYTDLFGNIKSEEKNLLGSKAGETISVENQLLQLKTATEFYQGHKVNPDNTLTDLTHEREDIPGSAKTQAKNSWIQANFGPVPPRVVCNHHVPYKEVKNKVRTSLIGQRADEVVARLSKVTYEPHLSDDGYDSEQINDSINNLIASTANDPRNLFYWPDTTGDEGGNARDLPAYSSDRINSFERAGIYGSLRESLIDYGKRFEKILGELNGDIY